MLNTTETHLVPATKKYKIPEPEAIRPRDKEVPPYKKVIWSEERRIAHGAALRAGRLRRK